MYWVVVEGVGRRLEVLGRYPCGEWNDSRCCWFRGSVLGGGDVRFRWILARYRYLGNHRLGSFGGAEADDASANT